MVNGQKIKMKRIIILAICLLLPFLMMAQEKINVKDKTGKKQGVWKKYENGQMVYEGQFKDDVPYGTFKYYHSNGKLKSVTEFQQGVHKVKTTIYHENGHKASEGAYRSGAGRTDPSGSSDRRFQRHVSA